MIKDNYSDYVTRVEPKIFAKYKIIDEEASHLVGSSKEKLYDYYLCDNCKAEIPLKSLRKEEKARKTITIPTTLTKNKELKLVVCNKCLKEVLKFFEKEAEG